MKLTRSQCKLLQTEYPVGNPYGGPAYGERRDFVGDILGGITGSSNQADAAQSAAATQAAASEAGIAEQKRQFDKIVELMAPFVTAGTGALTQQQALVGLGGPEAQQTAVSALESSPQMRALVQQGENAILQNASATGGLRGGNVQTALAKFRPNILNALIEQQYGRLGGLTSLGQASAAGQAAAGQTTGANIAQLLAQKSAAQAGGTIAAGNQQANTFGTIAGIGGALLGASPTSILGKLIF